MTPASVRRWHYRLVELGDDEGPSAIAMYEVWEVDGRATCMRGDPAVLYEGRRSAEATTQAARARLASRFREYEAARSMPILRQAEMLCTGTDWPTVEEQFHNRFAAGSPAR